MVVIDTPLPWPKPVFAHPLLDGVRQRFDASPSPTRVLAATPQQDVDAPASGEVRISVFDRGEGDGATEWVGRIDRDHLPELAAAVATTGLGRAPTGVVDGRGGGDVASGVGPRPMDRPTVLICTQGSHDVCCGSDGAPFAAEVEQQLGPAVTVRRVSHTGGHRFAPTLVTLPDGRMWADADLDLVRRVLWRTGEPVDVIDRCRGWWGAATGPAQIAEQAVLAEVGWEFDSYDRSVEVGSADGDGRVRCRVEATGRVWEVVVRAGREVPTIGCRVPGGLPAKSHREYAVEEISVTG